MHADTYAATPHASPQSAPASFSDFAALTAYLDSLGLFHMNPGLDRMRNMLAALGLVRPPYTVVQVVGTNGKGSTSTMLASLARAHGLRTGLHTSPHFLSVRERIRVDGRQLPEESWVGSANTLMARGGACLSYFEFVTCLAVLAFAEAGVDLAVMESGLGGSFDATTALEADLTLFTPIGLDHQAVLGPTLSHIARDKAGAIRPGTAVISAPQQDAALRELRLAAERLHAPCALVAPDMPLPATLSRPTGPATPPRPAGPATPPRPAGPATPPRPDRPFLALAGEHQLGNARLALAGWRHLLRHALLAPAALERARAAAVAQPQCEPRALPQTPEQRGLATAWLPGRMQWVPPLRADALPAAGQKPPLPECTPTAWPPLLLDGAHNSHGLAALGLSLARAGIAPLAVIFACLADKDLDEMLPHLRALATGPIFVPPIRHNPRSMPPEDLARAIGCNAVPAASLQEALCMAFAHMAERLPEVFEEEHSAHPLLFCGSLYLLGEFFALRPDCLEPPVADE